MALFFQSIARLVIAECACANLIFTPFIDVPSLVCVDPKYLSLYTSSSGLPFLHTLVWFWLNAVGDNFAFIGADFPTVSSSSLTCLSMSCWSSSSLPFISFIASHLAKSCQTIISYGLMLRHSVIAEMAGSLFQHGVTF